MSNTLTVRLPDDLSQWLEETARKSGMSRGMIVRTQLEKAKKSGDKPFMRLAGIVEGPPGLSARKGFSRK
jgi:predicted transcriptional regulator